MSKTIDEKVVEMKFDSSKLPLGKPVSVTSCSLTFHVAVCQFVLV